MYHPFGAKTGIWKHALDLQEKFPTVHPEQQQPHHTKRRDAVDEWLIRGAEGLERRLAEMGGEVLGDKRVEQVRDKISGDRIRPDDDEWKRPAFEFHDVDHPVERREEKKTPAATEQHPTGGPDSFHDGTDAERAQCPTSDQANDARDREPADFCERLTRTAKDISRD